MGYTGMRNKRAGILIACEGISASGKSKTICDMYMELNKNNVYTIIVEWNSNKIIRWIVKVLHKYGLIWSKLFSLFQWTSFLIDYFTKIKPHIRKGRIVIADRYIYTGLTRDQINGAGWSVGNIIYKHVIKPDLLIYHDSEPHICYERIMKRGKSLFHTNKKILQSNLLKNKDVYYLKKMKKEYERFFADHKVKSDTEIYVIENKFEKEYNTELDCIMEKIFMKVGNFRTDYYEKR